LKIGDLGERVIKPAMIQLANQIDIDLLNLYKDVPNWVGTPGQVVNSFADFAKAPERMDEILVPKANRSAILSPADNWGMLGSFSGLYVQETAKNALQRAKLPTIGDVDPYGSSNVATHTVGAFAGTPLVNGASQVSTYANVKDTNTQTLNTDGWTATTSVINAGDVFTIAGVYEVNPVTRATLPFLKQFTVVSQVTANGSGQKALTISPAIIVSGAFQNASAAPADNAAITVLGTASTGYRQNLAFHKNAFGLAMAPMEKPPGAVQVSRQSYKGIHVRVIPFYDGTNDVSKWRLDVLYGVKTLDPRLAVRMSGTA
jgi:hypothetical protein